MYDIDQWGDDEVWSYADRGFGDCEDYALEKRRALMKYIHPSNLLITFVKVPSGEFHVVLTVRTDRGDFFLDNNEPPMSVDESDYKILRIVDPRHEGRWVRVRGKESIEAWSGQAAATNSITSDLK
jgi:predicted transglutaminase-like cysteine proteinase